MATSLNPLQKTFACPASYLGIVLDTYLGTHVLDYRALALFALPLSHHRADVQRSKTAGPSRKERSGTFLPSCCEPRQHRVVFCMTLSSAGRWMGERVLPPVAYESSVTRKCVERPSRFPNSTLLRVARSRHIFISHRLESTSHDSYILQTNMFVSNRIENLIHLE